MRQPTKKASSIKAYSSKITGDTLHRLLSKTQNIPLKRDWLRVPRTRRYETWNLNFSLKIHRPKSMTKLMSPSKTLIVKSKFAFRENMMQCAL